MHKTKPLDENNPSPYKLPCCVRALMVAFVQTLNAVRDSQAWCDDGLTGLVWWWVDRPGVTTGWQAWCDDGLTGLVWRRVDRPGVMTGWQAWCDDRFPGLVWWRVHRPAVMTGSQAWCDDGFTGLLWWQVHKPGVMMDSPPLVSLHTRLPMTTDSAEPWVARVLCALSLGQISAAECTTAGFGVVLMDSLFLSWVLWHFFVFLFF